MDVKELILENFFTDFDEILVTHKSDHDLFITGESNESTCKCSCFKSSNFKSL